MWFGLGYLGSGIIFGCISKHINESKGYEGGFAWGFWLGVIGIIVVACRADYVSPSSAVSASEGYFERLRGSQKTWKCICGSDVRESLNYCPICRRSREEAQNTFSCPFCGANNKRSNNVCFACSRPLKETASFTFGSDPAQPDTVSDAPDMAGASTQEDIVSLLKKLGELHADGVLTDAEFQSKKEELLKRI